VVRRAPAQLKRHWTTRGGNAAGSYFLGNRKLSLIAESKAHLVTHKIIPATVCQSINDQIVARQK